MLLMVWWMYSGYAWLTNSIDLRRPSFRLLLLGAMAAWLVLALAIPQAFTATGLTFGLAYLAIVCLHTGLFTHAQSELSARSIWRVAQTNLVFAAAIVVGGALGGGAQWVIWAAAGVLLWLIPEIRGIGVFEIAPSHFVERHGLMIMIALGESVIAIGIGASELPVDLDLVATAVVGLLLVAGLAWVHFADEEAPVEAMVRADHVRRGRIGVSAFGYCHYVLLFGIVLVAAGLKRATGHPFVDATTLEAIELGAGVGLFLAGDAAFRAVLGLDGVRSRALGAILAPLTIPLGIRLRGTAGMRARRAALGARRHAAASSSATPRPASPPAQPR